TLRAWRPFVKRACRTPSSGSDCGSDLRFYRGRGGSEGPAGADRGPERSFTRRASTLSRSGLVIAAACPAAGRRRRPVGGQESTDRAPRGAGAASAGRHLGDGKVAAAPAQEHPAAGEQVVRREDVVLVGDLDVVEVGAPLRDGAAGGGASGRQAG